MNFSDVALIVELIEQHIEEWQKAQRVALKSRIDAARVKAEENGDTSDLEALWNELPLTL